MAELADAHGSGPCDSNIMRVQVPFPARYCYIIKRHRITVPFYVPGNGDYRNVFWRM